LFELRVEVRIGEAALRPVSLRSMWRRVWKPASMR
jgi:hypothetical protein